jgi:hypothetical protein
LWPLHAPDPAVPDDIEIAFGRRAWRRVEKHLDGGEERGTGLELGDRLVDRDGTIVLRLALSLGDAEPVWSSCRFSQFDAIAIGRRDLGDAEFKGCLR